MNLQINAFVGLVLTFLVGACGATSGTGTPEQAASSESPPPRTLDSTTFLVAGEPIRLWGVTAPSSDTAFGRQVEQELARLIADHAIACDSRERSGEVVTAICRLPDGTDLGAELVRRGWAFDEPSLETGAYDIQEDQAASRGRGLWAAVR